MNHLFCRGKEKKSPLMHSAGHAIVVEYAEPAKKGARMLQYWIIRLLGGRVNFAVMLHCIGKQSDLYLSTLGQLTEGGDNTERIRTAYTALIKSCLHAEASAYWNLRCSTIWIKQSTTNSKLKVLLVQVCNLQSITAQDSLTWTSTSASLGLDMPLQGA